MNIKATHRYVSMIVRVRVPKRLTAQQARREVRTLINDRCGYELDPEDIRAVSVKRPSDQQRRR